MLALCLLSLVFPEDVLCDSEDSEDESTTGTSLFLGFTVLLFDLTSGCFHFLGVLLVSFALLCSLRDWAHNQPQRTSQNLGESFEHQNIVRTCQSKFFCFQTAPGCSYCNTNAMSPGINLVTPTLTVVRSFHCPQWIWSSWFAENSGQVDQH